MTRILTYYEINSLAWQKLVDESPYATWFQTKEAYEFYAALPNEMQPFACGIEREGEFKAVCVGYVTKERCRIKQFYTRRAIIIGGPLIADGANEEDIVRMLYAVQQPYRLIACAGSPTKHVSSGALSPYRPTWRNAPIYIETRNFHDYSKWKDVFEKSGFAYQPHYDIHVACNASHTMSEQRRRQVKKAISNGAEICEAQAEQEIRDWYKILHQLYREKVRTPLFSEEFFLEFFRKGWGKYLLVKHEGKVIGGMMCPILDGRAIYEWYVCGLDEDYREQYPSVMATYAAIEYAKQNNLPLFDFMGAGKPDENYGVRDFKKEFGGEVVEYGRFLCIRKPLQYQIGTIGVKFLKRKRK